MSNLDRVHPALADGIRAKGYESLTPVQEAVLDPEIANADLLVSAQTGSGKTVAFGLAMAENLLEGAAFAFADIPRALIIAPTRELAMQVQRELQWLYGPTGAVIAGAVGGMDARAERRALERGAHIVVGTPGRICDHMRRGALDLSALRVAVLDEADEMLDLGFREDLEFILEAAPSDRRTLMFSATVSKDIARLAGEFQKDAHRISTVSAQTQHSDIEYRALLVDNADKENAIVNVLRFYEAPTAIVFCSTRAMVTHLTTRFLNRGFSVVALSGELSQDERSRALQMMRDGRARVCIATDVAARGIDLPGLELVVHADLPVNKEALLHRSGRTGRAGSKGVSAIIVPMRERKKAERLLGFAKITANWASAPSAEEVSTRDVERLLSDPLLTKPVTEDEKELVARLLSTYDAEALAGAVMRQFLAQRSAPEDLNQINVDGAPQPRREFGPSLFVKLSVGHAGRADPRWLLPMLCRAGDMSRRDIGAIRIFEEHTFAQIHDDARAKFLAGIGAGKELEDGIKVEVLDGEPEGMNGPSPRPARWDSKPAGGGYDKKPKRDFGDKPKRDYGDKPAYGDKPKRDYGDKPAYGDKPKRDYGDKPAYGDKPKRDYGDKPAYGDKPKRDYGDKPKPAYGDKPAYAGKPKPAGKPAGAGGDKPWAKKGGHGAPAAGAKPAKYGKPGAKTKPKGWA